MLTIFGICCLLLARGHYSIDVIIAYWITTRLWWIYHTLTKHEMLKASENSDNYLSKTWWWYIFVYFEGHVPIKLPREYGWPLPQKLLQWNVFRRRNLQQSNEDLEAGLQQQEWKKCQKNLIFFYFNHYLWSVKFNLHHPHLTSFQKWQPFRDFF